MYANCEGCYNLMEVEGGGYICNRYIQDLDRIDCCDEWDDKEDER